MAILRWTPKAAQDLMDIKLRIEQDDPETAIAVVRAILDRAEQLRDFPFSGPCLPVKRYPEDRMRYVVVKNHFVFYDYDTHAVSIIRVFHTRRDFLALLQK